VGWQAPWCRERPLWRARRPSPLTIRKAAIRKAKANRGSLVLPLLTGS